jgi:hypothetical protein
LAPVLAGEEGEAAEEATAAALRPVAAAAIDVAEDRRDSAFVAGTGTGEATFLDGVEGPGASRSKRSFERYSSGSRGWMWKGRNSVMAIVI